MQLTPLRYCRKYERIYTTNNTAPEVRTTISYGRKAYLTYDGDFLIKQAHGAWSIHAKNLYANTYTLQAAGLFDAQFQRRKDALEALATMIEEVA